MGLISEDSHCVLCNEPLNRPYLATSGCAFPQGHRLFRFCDCPLHIDCLNDWDSRVEFSEAYYSQRLEQFKREQWWILAESEDWFVGFIPPGRFMLFPGQEDAVEIRVRDWPFVLLGHAERWTEFLRGGWRIEEEQLHGMAAARAEIVVGEVSIAFPSTEAMVDAINQKLSQLR